MITFLPSGIYSDSAKILDNTRLSKQRTECIHLLRMLLGETPYNPKFNNAVNLWAGYEYWLIEYSKRIIEEARNRGFVDYNMEIIDDLQFKYAHKLTKKDHPHWISCDKLYASHRSNLFREFPEYYKAFDWCESYNLPYFWPEPLQEPAIKTINTPEPQFNWYFGAATPITFTGNTQFYWPQTTSWSPQIISSPYVPAEEIFVVNPDGTFGKSETATKVKETEATQKQVEELVKAGLLHHNPEWDKVKP